MSLKSNLLLCLCLHIRKKRSAKAEEDKKREVSRVKTRGRGELIPKEGKLTVNKWKESQSHSHSEKEVRKKDYPNIGDNRDMLDKNNRNREIE